MNEGWAVLIHEKIMNMLELPTDYHLAFIRLHNQVIRPHLGRVNPYHLGYKIFRHIEDKHGFQACLDARLSHNDETFIKSYLDMELCNELNLFSFAFNRREGIHRVTDVSGENSWRTIRDDLIKNIGLNSVPVVYVDNLEKDGTLVLKHEHDGRDLELAEANRVFEHINTLWAGGVRFTTVIEDETWEF
jgi:stage V sporulation protein R